MPIKVLGATERKQRAGVVVCRTHGPCCKKYPDHPAVQERRRQDIEFGKDLVEMIRRGQPRSWLKQLVDAGYELPEEFNRMDYYGPPQPGRAEAFIERYDLTKHFRSDEKEETEPPRKCETRKLSDDELRQRKEWAAEVKAARQRKGLPDPLPPWESSGPDPEVQRLLVELRPEFERRQKAERAALIQRLAADEELARKLQEALATWVSLPPRWSNHTQDVREGYGDAVPEFEEE